MQPCTASWIADGLQGGNTLDFPAFSCLLQDYDLSRSAEDWDDMQACCRHATEKRVAVSACSSLPPRPPSAKAAPTPASTPPPTTQLQVRLCVCSGELSVVQCTTSVLTHKGCTCSLAFTHSCSHKGLSCCIIGRPAHVAQPSRFLLGFIVMACVVVCTAVLTRNFNCTPNL